MTAWTIRRAAAATTCGAAAAVLLAACAGSSTPKGDPVLDVPVASSVTVTTGVVPGLGRIVLDGHGHALYLFPPDAGGQVSCTGACAGVWPPLDVPAGTTPKAGPGVNAASLSTLPDPNTGARTVTYLGYPLYRYSGDVRANVANGQALFNNGGPWYVLNPAGQPVTRTVASQ